MAQEERSTHWVAGRDSGVVKLSTDKWDQVASKVRIYRNALKSRLEISLVTRNSHQPLVGLAMTFTVMRPKKPIHRSHVSLQLCHAGKRDWLGTQRASKGPGRVCLFNDR